MKILFYKEVAVRPLIAIKEMLPIRQHDKARLFQLAHYRIIALTHWLS